MQIFFFFLIKCIPQRINITNAGCENHEYIMSCAYISRQGCYRQVFHVATLIQVNSTFWNLYVCMYIYSDPNAYKKRLHFHQYNSLIHDFNIGPRPSTVNLRIVTGRWTPAGGDLGNLICIIFQPTQRQNEASSNWY